MAENNPNDQQEHLAVLRALYRQHSEPCTQIDTRRFLTAQQIKQRLAVIRTTVDNTPLKKHSLHCKTYRRLVTENILLRAKLYVYDRKPQNNNTTNSNENEKTTAAEEALKQLEQALRRLDYDATDTERRDHKKKRQQALLLLMIFYDRYTTQQLCNIVDKYNKLLSQ
jgi:hypothetical protein